MNSQQPWSQTLEGRIPQIQREPWLQDLVKRLEKEDYLYPYHVTPSLLSTHDNEALFHYLERTYHQELFVIEDPKEIERYARPGDRVVKKGEYQKIEWQIKPGHRGTVKKNQGKQPNTVLVRFNGVKGLVEAAVQELTATKDKYFSLVTTLINPVALSNIDPSIRDCYHVQYSEKGLGKVTAYVPDGAEGLITAINAAVKTIPRLAITWARREDLLLGATKFTYDQYGTFRGIYLSHFFNPDEIKLIIPNTLDFPQLVEDCRKKYLTDGVPTGSISGNVVAITVRPADRKP